MKALLLLTLVASLAFGYAGAQSLSPSVVSSSGAFYSNGAGMLSSTIGEMAMVETFSAGSSILTQGFQQSFDVGVGVPEHPAALALSIFPNPTSGNIVIQLPDSYTGKVEANIFDAVGKLVFRKTVPLARNANSIPLSIESLMKGMYVLEVKTDTEHSFTKINLIK